MVGPVRVLLLCFGDDQYHDHGAIGAFLNELLSARRFDVEFGNTADALAPAALKRCDAVVLYAVNAAAPPDKIGHLLAAVSGECPNYRGAPVGFAGVHGSTTSFQDNVEYKRLIGASFVSHPDMGPAYRFAVKDRKHPVTRGVDDFELKDELYFFDYHAPFDTLVSCLYEGTERPAAWAKTYGRGRVFYLALGHGLEQTADPNFQTLLCNGIRWTAAE
jgi:type 1 glutamine amidotransferase